MHILLIHQAFASLDEPGGTRHHEFARILADRGHRVTIIASPVSYLTGTSVTPTAPAGSAWQFSRPRSIRILRARVYGAHHRSFVHRLLAFVSFMVSSFFVGLGQSHIDVVWGTSPPIFQGLTAWLVARLKGARFLFEVRDLWPLFAVSVGVLRNPVLIRLAEWLERFLYRRADALIVNSPGFVRHVSARGARTVAIVPNGADPAMFQKASNAHGLRKRWGPGRNFSALYAGAHGVSNDLGTLLAAAALVAADGIQIVLVGDGKDKPALVRQAAAANLANVTFLDPVPKHAMPDVIGAADAGIAILKAIPEYATTYPNKVFDYMAAGKPVVLAIDGVIRDVVERADCGLFAQPGDPEAIAVALRRLAHNRALARRLGRNGKHYLISHFSRSAIAGQLLGVLEGLEPRSSNSREHWPDGVGT